MNNLLLIIALLTSQLFSQLAHCALPPQAQNAKDLDAMVSFIKSHEKVAATLESITLEQKTVYFNNGCKASFSRQKSTKSDSWVGPAASLKFDRSNCSLEDGTTIATQTVNEPANTISYIDTQQAKVLFDGGAKFVDSRSWAETKLGMINGALHIPTRNTEKLALTLLTDKSAPVVVYCAAGVRADRTAKKLKILGYTNISVISDGQGYRSWKKAGFPLQD